MGEWMGGRENWRRMGGWEVGEDGEHGQDCGGDGRLGGWEDGWVGGWVAWMRAMMLAVLLFVGRADVGVDGCRTGTCIDVG